MKSILGEKIEMSQIFDKEGNVIPVTFVRATPNVVLRTKTKEKDGYEAVQLGFGTRNQKNIKKPQRGHFKNLGNFKFLKEFRTKNLELSRGDKIDVSVFQEGDIVKVGGVSKAKGFQGVVKRHGFHGASKTHGTKHAHRQPGSIGATWPQRGIKGRKMAGRMGGERVTVRNLKIVKVDAENNMLAIKGAIPGRRGTLLEIRG
ncbi:MAG: 50S ribosomal protein L3 [Candidatus Sungbacteria bacterium RIFCSPHIGHO2_02_FULL_47_11]|uniref:Large ribosomal subunit protein uL3 n=1 Tax=Candidatus Sungbacteria bacterium RIFCSPHIGHO2_02_FULL_47_11 TaxID=1802270 RepID=A0A1G2KLI0_9BACT|nr:MAG: 50S ribosomal protein L3 [Candidatus Sungbacteria bacterium RIFCSPHIGHO2_02_FULL_47_11]